MPKLKLNTKPPSAWDEETPAAATPRSTYSKASSDARAAVADSKAGGKVAVFSSSWHTPAHVQQCRALVHHAENLDSLSQGSARSMLHNHVAKFNFGQSGSD